MSSPPPERPLPYKCTPVFDENTLPAGLRKEHRTKPGVWAPFECAPGDCAIMFSTRPRKPYSIPIVLAWCSRTNHILSNRSDRCECRSSSMTGCPHTPRV